MMKAIVEETPQRREKLFMKNLVECQDWWCHTLSKTIMNHIMRLFGKSRAGSKAGQKMAWERVGWGDCHRILLWLEGGTKIRGGYIHLGQSFCTILTSNWHQRRKHPSFLISLYIWGAEGKGMVRFETFIFVLQAFTLLQRKALVINSNGGFPWKDCPSFHF